MASQSFVQEEPTIEIEGGKLNTFTCFPKLPQEIQLMIWKEAIAEPVVHNPGWIIANMTYPMQVVPELLSGINRMSYYEARKVYRRLSRALYFNANYDSMLLVNLRDLGRGAWLMEEDIVTSVQCSARICDKTPPLVDIERYLENEFERTRFLFPYHHLRTFVVQDLQCSRKHRLQDIPERVLCKEALERYFAKQRQSRLGIRIPKIIIRVPQQGDKLCYECEKLDEWLALSPSARTRSVVSIVDDQTTIPRQLSSAAHQEFFAEQTRARLRILDEIATRTTRQ
ncbi:hypothetical protein DSL72_005896 [Monilinia vaccinii-corymbosi]|uniref:2EXR domain-containing protein n=1 Tax=Monilinia vaccinii-corymbosi TaxID=61207 RepID=A0A8A3PH45_9HELO|nr:hypothetical protein DSL72_005896 [Monilinia vaccinii-corymbosi]